MLRRLGFVFLSAFLCVSCVKNTQQGKSGGGSNSKVININDAAILVKDGEYLCNYDFYLHGTSIYANNSNVEAPLRALLKIKKVSDVKAEAAIVFTNGMVVAGKHLMLQPLKKDEVTYEQSPSIDSAGAISGISFTYKVDSKGEVDVVSVSVVDPRYSSIAGVAYCKDSKK